MHRLVVYAKLKCFFNHWDR